MSESAIKTPPKHHEWYVPYMYFFGHVRRLHLNVGKPRRLAFVVMPSAPWECRHIMAHSTYPLDITLSMVSATPIRLQPDSVGISSVPLLPAFRFEPGTRVELIIENRGPKRNRIGLALNGVMVYQADPKNPV